MQQEQAETITKEYIKPVYGFMLKRCAELQDAEDLTQEVLLRVYRTLLSRDDILSPRKFIWAVAHNALSNYYRSKGNTVVGIPISEISEILAEENDTKIKLIEQESTALLHTQIAYLSKMQRRIVIAYYFENKKQETIAAELCIALGTVKWHLFEARKDLKRGMDTMRRSSELKFNPIKFHSYGINGCAGKKSVDDIFRSTLTQNICYCVRDEAKTINEIADDLGVSPVYIETEAAFLEEYGFLQDNKGKYIINFIISKPTANLLCMHNNMYSQAAELFANDLYDELTKSGILDDPGIRCGLADKDISIKKSSQPDKNFILWSLIPYIAAWSGEKLRDNRITFEQVATTRPDGAYNIFHASVVPDNIILPNDYVYMKNWCGPMWNGNGKHILWQIDSEWSDRDTIDSNYSENAQKILSLFEREYNDRLSKDEYAWLAQKGYVKTNGAYEEMFKSEWQIVTLENKDIKSRLLAIGDSIKEKYKNEFDALKAAVIAEELKSVSQHLRKIKEYELQFVFYSDGWFLIHCITTLLKNGKMHEPTPEQKKALTTLIIPE